MKNLKNGRQDEKTRISSFADTPSVVSLKVIMESASWNQNKMNADKVVMPSSSERSEFVSRSCNS